ncbi:MAG: Proton/glutamate-aspartate symporter [Chlamydiia bacterium]|nr:Proton/glutamate-aspartate symporter [Chlamydiia bacterium]MCH9616482.1 Proton/glutamate-aspartate symporter [Chlamydiia bacterium]MCH9629532.1 Proton/glutamate-aspartate symporter [Chlamydiia bacterium]
MKKLLVALLLGGGLGYFNLPWLEVTANLIVDLFTNVLRLMSLPIIFFSILATLTNMASGVEAKKLFKTVLKYTLLTTLVAASVALALFVLISPAHSPVQESIALGIESINYLDFVKQIIPTNPISPFLENNVLGICFMAAVLGIAINYLPEDKKTPLKNSFVGFFNALLKLSSAVITILPVAVFAFTYQFVKNFSASDTHLLYYALTVVLANVIQGCIVLPLLLRAKGISPLKFAKQVLPALAMAFFSKSSNATLPISLECAEKSGIRSKVSSFSLPLCSVINMNGCAAFILITTLFVATSNGMTFSVWQMLPWILISTIAAVGNAGVPMGCFFLTSAFLIGMNVPLGLMGIILPFYALFDMIETSLNVWSDLCVTNVTDKELFVKKPVSDTI